MKLDADRLRSDFRHKRLLAARPPGNPAPKAGGLPATPATSLTASLAKGRAHDRVLMAAMLRCQHRCPRWLTTGSDNLGQGPSSGLRSVTPW
jgi:hypothetical protein